jgi:hypothetical protein
MNLFDQIRHGIARRLRRPTTLVVVGRPEPLPGSRPRRALPPSRPFRPGGAPRLPRSAGYAAYGRVIAAQPGQQQPLGRSSFDPRPLIRDTASAWREGGPDVSDYRLDADLEEIRADLHTPRIPWWER